MAAGGRAAQGEGDVVTDYKKATLRRLWALVDRVAPREPGAWEERPPLQRGVFVSATRAKQLRSTLRQLELAVDHPDMPEGCYRSVEDLLAPESLDAFLELATDGAFRSPQVAANLGKPLSWASRSSLRDCLKILGEEAGAAVVLPRVHTQPPKEVMPPQQALAVWRKIAGWAARGRLPALQARALAVVGVILDTGMQTGPMTELRVDDVDLEAGRIRAVYRPQNSAHREPVEAVLPLRKGTVVALHRWLEHRQSLVARLAGQDHGMLWVTTRPVYARRLTGPIGQRMEGVYAAGMPLRPRGFEQAHRRAMQQLNDTLAGQWEVAVHGPWVPLPTTPEALRRSVDVEALVPELAEARGRFAAWDAGQDATRAAERGEPVRRKRGPAKRPVTPGVVPSWAAHGREHTYRKYECRCPLCVEAARAVWRRRTARAQQEREAARG